MKAPLLVALLASLLLAGCAGEAGNAATSEDAGGAVLADVHGIAFDPQNSARVLVATHFGLFSGSESESWARVGDAQHDLMGFVVGAESGRYWASGHPRTGGNLGVVRSDDGGLTWTSGGLDGVDFHAMAISSSSGALWGAYRGDLLRTDDDGARWYRVATGMPALRSLAAHPTEPDTLFASTGSSILMSVDGGASWTVRSAMAAHGLALDPHGEVLYAAGAGGVHASRDGGATWTRLAWEGPGRPGYVAVHPDDPRVLLMATFETGIHRSTDGGATWDLVRAPRAATE